VLLNEAARAAHRDRVHEPEHRRARLAVARGLDRALEVLGQVIPTPAKRAVWRANSMIWW
jgi:hypothetical protein